MAPEASDGEPGPLVEVDGQPLQEEGKVVPRVAVVNPCNEHRREGGRLAAAQDKGLLEDDGKDRV